jgi:hypothetical protein
VYGREKPRGRCMMSAFVCLGYLVYKSEPDFRRYLKIEMM